RMDAKRIRRGTPPDRGVVPRRRGDRRDRRRGSRDGGGSAVTVEAAAAAIVPDPALPQRDVLFDTAAMRSLFQAFGRCAPARVDGVALVRVNYQVGKSVRVVYRALLDGGTHTVAARMFRGGKSAEQHARACATAFDVGHLRGVLRAPALESVLWLF